VCCVLCVVCCVLCVVCCVVCVVGVGCVLTPRSLGSC
jgi:hypothetical protein